MFFPVDVHRGPDVRMPHQFLLHFHRSACLIEKRPKGVPERVPADPSETTAKSCGRDMHLLHSPGIPRGFARFERARKHPILAVLE